MTQATQEPLAPALDSALRKLDHVAVVGGNGMLGRAFQELLAGRVEHAVFGKERLDITDATSLRRCAMGPWKTYINCAAFTDVDGAETNEQGAMALNATGVALLAKTCREAGATLVHFSTDYVFDGQATTPYATRHRRAPVGVYARSKALGEEAIEREAAQGLNAMTIRTSWLYAPWGKNFVRTIAKLAKEKPVLRVVSDQRGRPTSAEHLARATVMLLGAGIRGTTHVTDGGECSWFDFAATIAAKVNTACKVTPCTTDEYPRPAKRPAYSVLDLSATEAAVGPMPHWKTNLAAVLPRLEP
jgi:dTDP-4-dehydrorhamnose reductase